MNKIKITEKHEIKLPMNFSALCRIIEQFVGNNSCVIEQDGYFGEHYIKWERLETDEEASERIAKTAKTKNNLLRSKQEQLVAIEKRIAKDQEKLAEVKKVIAQFSSE
jgi:hypothetical protein